MTALVYLPDRAENEPMRLFQRRAGGNFYIDYGERTLSDQEQAERVAEAIRKGRKPPATNIDRDQRSLGTTDRELAEAIFLRVKAEHAAARAGLRAKLDLPALPLRWTDAAAAFLRQKKAAGKADRTIERYDEIIRKHVGPAFAEHPINGVTRERIERYIEKRTAVSAKATVACELAVISGILTHQVALGNLGANAASGLRIEIDVVHDRVLTHDEVDSLVRASSPELGRMIRLSFHAGLRAGEIRHLTWDRVNFEARTIRVAPVRISAKKWWYPKHRISREVKLNSTAIRVLREQAEQARFQGPWVFPSPKTGTPYRSLSPIFARARDAAGLTGEKHARFHDLRHSSATYAALMMNLKSLMAQYGWKSIEVANGYIHRQPDGDFAALEAFAQPPPKQIRSRVVVPPTGSEA